MTKLLLRFVLVLLLLPILLVVAVALLRVGPPPQVDIQADRPGIGHRTEIMVHLQEPPRGLGVVKVELQQETLDHVVAQRTDRPKKFWAFWGAVPPPSDDINFSAGRETEGLRPGTA